MLTDQRLEEILNCIPSLTLAVVGDLFLDRYLDIDAALTEPSLETGLEAYQVTRVRSFPGAAGTVINNLAALGVGQIHAISFIGDDGEGYELRGALENLRVVDTSHVLISKFNQPYYTPTYTKPLLHQAGHPPRELNRLDIKNRGSLPEVVQEHTTCVLRALWPEVDALLVVDQVSEPNCGVITRGVREVLVELGETRPEKLILADSRERIGLFRSVTVKPNQTECRNAIRDAEPEPETTDDCAAALARMTGRPVFCTCGERGTLVVEPRLTPVQIERVPAYPVSGPIDIVGAGDSTSAAIACALATGASSAEAAAFGNLIASITIQQIGTTGTATPAQARLRWQQVRKKEA